MPASSPQLPSSSTPYGVGKEVNMLNRKHAVLGVLALIALTALVAAGAISAGGTDEPAEISPVGQRLEGTWTTTVNLVDPPPGVDTSFRALNTFTASGELLVSSSVGMPSLRSLAHGEWLRTGNRRFASTFVFFRFDPTGRFIGTQKVHRTIRLQRRLDVFHSTDVIEIIDPNGNVLRTFGATEVGERLTIRTLAHDEGDSDSSARGDDD